MTQDATADWQYAEGYIPEDDVLLAARDAADQLGCVPVFPGVGRALTVMAAAIQAKNVAEIGTGAGVSGIYLLRGMDPAGVLTTIDMEPENQKVAREMFAEAGFAAARYRMIGGTALEVLPRLTDGAYDLVLADARKAEYIEYVDHAVRILRPRGVLALDNMLWHSKVADPAQRDHNTTAVRETLKYIRAHEQLTAVLVPSGDGLVLAVKSG